MTKLEVNRDHSSRGENPSSQVSVWLHRLGFGIGASALVILMHQPTLESMRSTLPWNLGDPALGTWILSWQFHALVADISNFFNGNMFHPYGEALKYSELMLPLVIPFGLVEALTGSEVVAHNFVLLALAVFCFISTFVLARRLAGAPVALLASASFTFSGYVFMHQGHLQLLTLGFFPLAFLTLFRALESRRLRDGLWLGLSTALLTTASLYYGAIWFVCVGVIVMVDLIRHWKPQRDWWTTFAAAGLVTAATVGPVALVFAGFQNRVPFEREVGGMGLNPIDFLTPAPESLAYGRLFNWSVARQPSGIVEHGFFLGLVVPVLALIGGALFLRFRTRSGECKGPGNRYELGLLALVGVVSLVLAMGPTVLGFPMPFRLFSELVPGFDSIRAASRLAVPGLLAIAIFAAYGLKRLSGALEERQLWVVVAIITSIVLVEMWVAPLRATVEDRAPMREILASAAPGAVLELPMRAAVDIAFVFIEGPRLLESIGDWRRRFNGFSGGFPPGYSEAVAALVEFPAPQALTRISELDIRYVLLHGSAESTDAAYSFDEIDWIISQLPSGVSVRHVGDDWLVDLRPEQ